MFLGKGSAKGLIRVERVWFLRTFFVLFLRLRVASARVNFSTLHIELSLEMNGRLWTVSQPTYNAVSWMTWMNGRLTVN